MPEPATTDATPALIDRLEIRAALARLPVRQCAVLVLSGLSFATVSDPSTWFPAADAVPGGAG